MEITHIGNQGSLSWLHWRKQGIGASESSAILGINPWMTREQLRLRKIGLLGEQEDNRFMARGRRLEESIRRHCEEKYGTIIFPRLYQNDEYPFILASLDGLSLDKKTIFEFKTCNAKTLNDAKIGIVPEYYRCQCQHQLLAGPKEATKNILVFYCEELDEYAFVEILPDLEYQERLVREITQFWETRFETPEQEEVIEAPASIAELLEVLATVEPLYKQYATQREEILSKIKELSNGRDYTHKNMQIKHTTRRSVAYKDCCVANNLDVSLYTKETTTFSVKFKE